MENLLDKFIRNEKKAKLWAALSLLAFFTVATSVIVVAYQIKNNTGRGVTETKTDTGAGPDTVFISKEDPATATLINTQSETIGQLKDSLKVLQVKYEVRSEDLNKYMTLWTECENNKPKPGGGDPPPPPPAPLLSVLIYVYNYPYPIPDTSVEKLKNFLYKRDNSKNGMAIDTKQTQKGNKPIIVYYDDQFFDQANYIAKILNGSNTFYPRLRLSVIRGNAAQRVSDIEIWPGNFR